jgi:hypothetical protein
MKFPANTLKLVYDSERSGAVDSSYIYGGDIIRQHAALLRDVSPQLESWIAVKNARREQVEGGRHAVGN